MRPHRPGFRRTARLLLAAMLVLAVLPTLRMLVHPLAGESAARWVELCTAHGVVSVRVVDTVGGSGGSASDPAGSETLRTLCPLCSLHADPVMPTMAQTPGEPVRVAVLEVPRRFLQAPRTPHAWRPAAPRGPPSASA